MNSSGGERRQNDLERERRKCLTKIMAAVPVGGRKGRVRHQVDDEFSADIVAFVARGSRFVRLYQTSCLNQIKEIAKRKDQARIPLYAAVVFWIKSLSCFGVAGTSNVGSRGGGPLHRESSLGPAVGAYEMPTSNHRKVWATAWHIATPKL
jgi:hypothetical protein